jgi:tRNA wybutosine-synthesizing protein 3
MSSWQDFKKKALERINHDKEIGYLDPDIYDLLMAFFKREKTYTYSSCSGRITIVDSILPWVRKNSTIVFKNHLGITEEDIVSILNKGQLYRLWLITQGPIVHAYTEDEQEAWEIIKIARDAGFKHSGILTKNFKGVLVELRTGIRFVHLMRENENQKFDSEDISRLVKISNEILLKGKEKMKNLQSLIELSIRDNPMKLWKNPEMETHFHYSVS